MHFFCEPENERFSVFQETRATGTQNANKWAEPESNGRRKNVNKWAEPECKSTGGVQMQISEWSPNANKRAESECKLVGRV